MPIEEKVYKALAGDPSLKLALKGGVNAVRIPQNTKTPAIVYYRVSGVPYNCMGDGYGLSRVRIRLDVWGETYTEIKDAAELAKRAVAGAPDFEKMIENSGPDWGDDKTFRTSIDVICWEKEGVNYE